MRTAAGPIPPSTFSLLPSAIVADSLLRRWRAGPTGVKSLCNACGLRWAKTQRSSASVSSAASVAAKSPPLSTSGSMESSASPVQWR